jgi:hypothetical protein
MSRPERSLASQLSDLTEVLLDTDNVAGVLGHVVASAVELIPDADLVSVTLRSPDGRFYTPVETNPMALELDELQYRCGHGPCMSAADKTGPGHVHSGDLANASEWPVFGPGAARRGYRSILSTTLVPGARPPRLSGALNIYAAEPGKLGSPEDRDVALLLATHASLALAGTEAVRLADLQEAQLRAALDSRDVIGQAKGILMHRRGLSADEAFDLLRRTSQDLNYKLADLARLIAARHTELPL